MDALLYNIYSILSDIYMLILHKISVFWTKNWQKCYIML